MPGGGEAGAVRALTWGEGAGAAGEAETPGVVAAGRQAAPSANEATTTLRETARLTG
jgi:hypothetical protein